MQFCGDRLINPGDPVGQKFYNFWGPTTFFPCKGRGLCGRDFSLTVVKEHIEVHPHTLFRGDWPVNSGDIKIKDFSGRNFGRPRGARGASQRHAVRCSWRRPGYLKAQQVWWRSADKQARYWSSNFALPWKQGVFFFAPAPRPAPPHPASNQVKFLELWMPMVDPPTTQTRLFFYERCSCLHCYTL